MAMRRTELYLLLLLLPASPLLAFQNSMLRPTILAVQQTLAQDVTSRWKKLAHPLDREDAMTLDAFNATSMDCLSEKAASHNTSLMGEARHRELHPPFPISAYNLAADEKRLQYNFLSFIDYTNEPYSQVTRLVEPRLYARSDQFDRNMMDVPPTIDDVAPPPNLYGGLGTFLAWNRLPARAVVGTLAYFAFPSLVTVLEYMTRDVGSAQGTMANLVNTFLPGVSIVLGTYFSLTLSILYDRFTRLQEAVSVEASLLALTCQNLLDLFHDDQDAAIEGAQCIADQVRTLVRDSRGREIMAVIYSDPYLRILRLVKKAQTDHEGSKNPLDSHLVADVRGTIAELVRIRAKRMADEALALAPTHFDVMTFLCGLLLVGFALSAVEADTGGELVTKILFSALIVCYVTLYEMTFDLNRPFDGVYQLRRSSSAMHFLQVKHIISNHPLVRGMVSFEEVPMDEDNKQSLTEWEEACKNSKAKIWYN